VSAGCCDETILGGNTRATADADDVVVVMMMMKKSKMLARTSKH